MVKKMLIQLSRKDVHACTMLGNDTVKICEMQGVNPRLENNSQSRAEANIFGFKAEYAVARLFDLEPTSLTIKSDFGVDLWLDDVSIDVKFSNRIDGDLIFDSKESFKSEISILVCRTERDDVMKIAGWCFRKNFYEFAKPHNYGWGERLRIKQEWKILESIEMLWWAIKSQQFQPTEKLSCI
jgi:hypothetical protein